MKRFVLGVILASLALYVWGFLYWGFGPYGKMIWKRATDDEAAGSALLEYFPENGTYYLPAVHHDPETLERLFQKGPLAFVHMLSTEGGLVFDPAIMIEGFGLNVIVVILIGLLMQQVAAALPRYGDRARFAIVGALAAAVLIDVGDAVWWRMPWDWQLYRAFYHFVAWSLTGLILAKFVGPASPRGVSGG